MFFKLNDWIVGLFFTVFGSFVLNKAVGFDDMVITKQKLSQVAGPSWFPTILAVLMITVGLIYLIGSIVVHKGKIISSIKKYNFSENLSASKKVYIMLLISFIYIFLFPITGYLLTTIAYMFVLLKFLGYKKQLNILIISFVFSLFLFFMFDQLLSMRLPTIFSGFWI